MKVKIPLTYMRGGTSKGLYILKDFLPEEVNYRDNILLKLLGSQDKRQIDGLGNGDSLTNKVALISKSKRKNVDIDYLFAQILLDENRVNTDANCGNILSGVGPFSIDNGLVSVAQNSTFHAVKVYNENTGTIIECIVPVLNGRTDYSKTFQVDSMPALGCDIQLYFSYDVGKKFGALFPTGNVKDEIYGIPYSLIDSCLPVLILRADCFGLSGKETFNEIKNDHTLIQKISEIRKEVLCKIDMKNQAMLPKVALLAPAQNGGHLRSFYFTPHSCHSAHAVTGANCIASACFIPGTIAYDFSPQKKQNQTVLIEHFQGIIDVKFEFNSKSEIERIGFQRSAQILFEGQGIVLNGK